MADPEYAPMDAFTGASVCSLCGCLVYSRLTHSQFHEALDLAEEE